LLTKSARKDRPWRGEKRKEEERRNAFASRTHKERDRRREDERKREREEGRKGGREEERGRGREREKENEDGRPTEKCDTYPKVVDKIHGHVETAIRSWYYLVSISRVSARATRRHTLAYDAEGVARTLHLAIGS